MMRGSASGAEVTVMRVQLENNLNSRRLVVLARTRSRQEGEEERARGV